VLIIPAIDLIDGICVRLLQGRFDAVTRYGDPGEQLAAFADAGAAWVHIVDLDGARQGAPAQHETIARLARTSRVNIQCGGGVRERAHLASLLDAGVARVVVGSAASQRPTEVAAWIEEFGPDKICCAFDVRAAANGFAVAIEGWRGQSGLTLDAALGFFPELPRHALITDISRDGALTGPNVELIADTARRWPHVQVQASGGVSDLADLRALRATGAGAAIVGRALYERRFTLEAALAC
jgi:phosphoribosylformimino-5-aminoimidazole carboxamide ribotide isomerase